MNLRIALHLFVLSSGILAAVRGPGSQAGAPLRYARVATESTAILNLNDEKGLEIARPAKGQLLAVYRETSQGWLEVEVPGGFPVWVFGRYLAPTSDPNLYEVTGNAVNLRPAPSSDVGNFPLPQRLQAGDKVRVIEVLEPEKPVGETWVRLWSPPGVRGFVQSTRVETLASGEDGAALWAAALQALPAAPPLRASQARATEASAVERKDAEAHAALAEARAALERERARETPDYDAVEKALDAVVARGGAVAIEARAELRTLAQLREAAAIQADILAEKERLAAEALRRQREVLERSREKDPFGGVFAARGVVERRTGADGVARFYVQFGGNTVCELTCPSGRYDLSVFAGTEIGVHGTSVTSRTGEVPTYEVARLEVLTVR